jgi:carbonic anhydrase
MRNGIWIVAAAALLLATNGRAETAGHGDGHGGHWSYTGETGPAHWGDLSEAYHACAAGTRQSPVDIRAAAPHHGPAVALSYETSPLRLVNNGHTVQVNYADGSTLTVDGKTYSLAQFHFHSPSEHTRDGEHAVMEAHLVHQADDGSLAVVGVFLKEGAENPMIARIWDHLPDAVNHEVHVPEVRVNVADLLPAELAYLNYDGSLTTPPCTEGVTWLVVDGSVEVSRAQADRFLALIHPNARPVQPLNDRAVRRRM